MRFSPAMVWLFGVVTVALCTTAAAAQTTQRARLMVQAGGSDVGSVALSPDRRRVLTGGNDNIPRLWDVETGKELRRFEGHSSPDRDGCESPRMKSWVLWIPLQSRRSYAAFLLQSR